MPTGAERVAPIACFLRGGRLPLPPPAHPLPRGRESARAPASPQGFDASLLPNRHHIAGNLTLPANASCCTFSLETVELKYSTLARFAAGPSGSRMYAWQSGGPDSDTGGASAIFERGSRLRRPNCNRETPPTFWLCA